MSERLRERLAAAIRARGPMPFSAFMEAALYDPDEGFFARTPPGPRGHFVTSPHVSAVFGMLVANQLRDAWRALGEPRPYTVVDAGAGDGALASQVLQTASSDEGFAAALRYVAVERSAGARAALGRLGLEVRETLPERITGCVVANELLDNLPFDLVRRRDGVSMEVLVDLEDGRLVERERPVPPAREGPVPSGARAFVRNLARALERGYAFLFDYGFVGGEEPEPVRGYRAHRLQTDLLADPGSTDITGPVDFAAVAAEAGQAGLQAWGPVTQRDALHALGYRAVLDALRARQDELERAGKSRDAVEAFGARGDAATLVDPGGLGGLKLLALGTAGLPEPLAVARS